MTGKGSPNKGRKEKKGEEVELRPLPPSSLTSVESIGPTKLMVAIDYNEWGATQVSHAPKGRVAPPLVPFFLHTVLYGLVPSFSDFSLHHLGSLSDRSAPPLAKLHGSPRCLRLLMQGVPRGEAIHGPFLALLQHEGA